VTASTRRLHPGDEARAIEVGTSFDAAPFAAERVASFLANPANYLLIAEDAGELAGYVIAYRLDRLDREAKQLFIYDLGVSSAHRRRGVGTALMAQIRKLVAAESMMEAFVLTDRDNEAAIGLYRASGGVEAAPGSLLFLFPGVEA